MPTAWLPSGVPLLGKTLPRSLAGYRGWFAPTERLEGLLWTPVLQTSATASNDVRRRYVMAVQLFHVGDRTRRAGYVPAVIGPIDTLGRDGAVSAGLLCACTAVSLGVPPDDVIVLRVAGEVDLSTGAVLQAALADSLARGPCDLLVDLAAMAFCDVRGLRMIVQVGATAAERGVGYAVAAAPRQVRRVWPMLWPAAELPVQYPSAAAGVLAAMTRLHDDDLARWALKRGPGWSRRWPTPPLQDVPGRRSMIAERLMAPLA